MAIYVKNNKDFDDKPNLSRGPAEDAAPRVLSANLVQTESRPESFPFGYLPRATQRLLREAFGCYSADFHLAFAILCRHTIAASEHTGTEPAPASFERLFDDAVALAGIDAGVQATLRDTLFGPVEAPELDAEHAAILIEIIKDMFQQRYVRGAKLRRAIKMRRYFALESQA